MHLRLITCAIALIAGGCAAVEGHENENEGSGEVSRDPTASAEDFEVGEQTHALCSNQRGDLAGNVLVSSGSWGSWGCMDYCPAGSWVKQIRTLWDCVGGNNDCSGANIIELSCHAEGSGDPYVATISSSRGWWGQWFPWVAAPNNGFATGFKTWTMPNQGGGDDSALTRADLVNSSGTWGPVTNYAIDITSTKSCPSGARVCGIRTRLESKQGTRADDTALNGVEIGCCFGPF